MIGSAPVRDVRRVPATPRISHRSIVSWIEVVVSLGLIEATIWTAGKTQLRLFWLAAAFIVVSTVVHRPKLDQLGLGLRGLAGSLWVIPAALAVATVGGVIAWYRGSLHPLFGSGGTLSHSSAYVLWAVLQQFILQSYIFLRLERLLKSGRAAVVVSAGIFCLVHVPNPVLVLVCLPAGYFACEVFRRKRNIYALGVAHGILGLAIAVTVPDHVQRHMRVGAGYYRYGSQQRSTPPTPFRLGHR